MQARMSDETPIGVHLEYIKAGVDGITRRLDALNDRTRTAENTIAVHSWALGLGGAVSMALFVWILSRL